ncbi:MULTISPECIES: type VI secretion system Vgr family protein [unclassified Paraburkholderia]|uniref:type VI secretion system Vgr family protein n=1 Tax=unclassified Paraburkholderia TaxID=2615204 RepID=UPI002AB27DC8|nr:MULTISPECIES: type VI secretion system Vgr family protein [unclassified Paraburkholderia]
MGVGDIYTAITSGLAQHDRLLKLDTLPGSSVLLPVRAWGRSRVGRQFEFTLDVVSTSSDIELKRLIAQPVTLWLQQSDKSYRPHNGYVHTARRLGSDGGVTSYQLGFASWMHFLKFRSDARIWQEKSADDILSDVFNAHPQAMGMFKFALSKPLPSRSYCTQYEDDWTFVHRLMESEGLFGFWMQADDGKSHTLNITDRIEVLPALAPQTVDFYRAGASSETDALVQWSGTRTLRSSTLTTRTYDYKNPSSLFNPKGTSVLTLPNQGALPEQTEVYEYTGAYTYYEQDRGDHLSKIRMEEWESSAKRFHGSGAIRGLDAGRWFELDDHPAHSRDAAGQREFAVIDVEWLIENNLPTSQSTADFPHSLKNRLDAAREMHGARGISTVTHPDGSAGFYLTEFEAQRKTVPFRSPLEHHKPEMRLQTATVVGPAGEEIYTDELARVKVQFHWDRLARADQQSSCWLRVVQPWSSGGFGGLQLPRIGDEVAVSFIDGDPDRPVVTGRLGNGINRAQWSLPAQQALSGFVSKELGGQQNNVWLKDDTPGQVQTQLRSDHLESGLHMGYLTRVREPDGRQDKRGEGVELRTDGNAAVRGAKGLLLTTHERSGASGDAFSVDEVTQQLTQAHDTANGLAQAAKSAEAQDGEQNEIASALETQAKAIAGGGPLKQFTEPQLVIASPAGIAASTPDQIHLSGGQTAAITSGNHVSISAGGGLFASARRALRMFVYEAGMRLVAAGGDIDLKALKDSINVLAKLNVTVTADKVTISAQHEVQINGGGSYVKFDANGIEHGTPGNFVAYASSHSLPGPKVQPVDLSPKPVCIECMLKAAKSGAAIVPV